MSSDFKYKNVTPQETRLLNVELLCYINEKNPKEKILKNEKVLNENLLDYAISKGNIGSVDALLKSDPKLVEIIPQNLRIHVKNGSSINIKNYLKFIPELKELPRDLMRIAKKNVAKYPDSLERAEILKMLKDLKHSKGS